MTDIEMVRACARVMGIDTRDINGYPYVACEHYLRDTSDEKGALKIYSPLTDKAQAMDLVTELRLFVKPWPLRGCDGWIVGDENETAEGRGETLLRAICECAANVQLAKEGK